MTNPIMIWSRVNGGNGDVALGGSLGNVIDIQGNSTKAGALLDAFQPKVGTLSLAGPTTAFAANQTWEILPDPGGSKHFIIKNPATGHCIDIEGNSTARGASLDAFPATNHDNQLWDFLPDPFGSKFCFIQNPRTGYVIEIKNRSSQSGALLVVNPRRLYDNAAQLWAGVDLSWQAVTFPSVKLASPAADLKSTSQYVLQPKDQSKNMTGITVTLDIIEDLVADSFSVQINGNPPYPGPKVPYVTQWIQFGLVMQDNNLVLFNQLYHAPGPDPAGNPLPSKCALSGSMLRLENNTVPAGTRIVMKLSTDQNDYVTGVTGTAYDKSDSLIGGPVPWSVIGQATWHGGPVQESDLAPLGAFQVVVVGAPSSHAHFTSGLGAITVSCTPDIAATLSWPNPTDYGTGETSNCYYGKVQEGYFPQISQPFGLPRPKIDSVSGVYTFLGKGLLPNSKLTATAIFWNENTALTDPGSVGSDLRSGNDGSFAVGVQFKDSSVPYTPGLVTVTVTDADGNWTKALMETIPGTPVGVSPLSSTSGLRQ